DFSTNRFQLAAIASRDDAATCLDSDHRLSDRVYLHRYRRSAGARFVASGDANLPQLLTSDPNLSRLLHLSLQSISIRCAAMGDSRAALACIDRFLEPDNNVLRRTRIFCDPSCPPPLQLPVSFRSRPDLLAAIAGIYAMRSCLVCRSAPQFFKTAAEPSGHRV